MARRLHGKKRTKSHQSLETVATLERTSLLAISGNQWQSMAINVNQ